MGNAAYPKLSERESSGAAGPAARHRYAIVAADSPRTHRFRPSTAPVRVKRPWGDAVYVPSSPVSAAPPPPPLSARLLGGSRPEDGANTQQGGTSGDGRAGGGCGSAAASGGGGGLAALLGKSNKKRLSLKTVAKLSSAMSGVQARAKAKEQERTLAEREAHYASLRTALGTFVDYHQPYVPSTASAIEATMADELLRAIPPKKDRSPQHLRRSIDKLETRLEAKLGQGRKPSPPKSRKPFMRDTSRGREDRSMGSSLRSSSSGKPHTPRQHGGTAGAGGAPSSVARHGSGGGSGGGGGGGGGGGSAGGSGQHAQAHGSTKPGGGSGRLPIRTDAGRLADRLADPDITLEALPMPTPGRFRRRHRSPARDVAPVSSLASAKEHTLEVQEALANVGSMLKRESLRRLVARILDDPSLLPPGALDGEGDALEGGAPPPEGGLTPGENERDEPGSEHH